MIFEDDYDHVGLSEQFSTNTGSIELNNSSMIPEDDIAIFENKKDLSTIFLVSNNEQLTEEKYDNKRVDSLGSINSDSIFNKSYASTQFDLRSLDYITYAGSEHRMITCQFGLALVLSVGILGCIGAILVIAALEEWKNPWKNPFCKSLIFFVGIHWG